MTFKELLNINNIRTKIKLESFRNEHSVSKKDEEDISPDEKIETEKFSVNEWKQEYELIYLSYVLER